MGGPHICVDAIIYGWQNWQYRIHVCKQNSGAMLSKTGQFWGIQLWANTYTSVLYQAERPLALIINVHIVDVEVLSFVYVLYSGVTGRQGYGAPICWRGIWWQCQANAVSLLIVEDAANSTWERHCCLLHHTTGLQVSIFKCQWRLIPVNYCLKIGNINIINTKCVKEFLYLSQ